MTHQKKHIRTSKKGKRFAAGKSGPIKVGDIVQVKNTIDTQWVNPSGIGRTGKVIKVIKEPFLHYNVRIKGQSGYWEAHRGEIKKVKTKKEEIRTQVLPSPDEAQLTWCPWCGAEYDIEDTESSAFYDTIDDNKGIYRHKKCGKLVKMVSWAND
jgi:hypothetical protein